jgi:hypothetical protein
MGSLVLTLNAHLKSEPTPPDHRPSSNVDFPVAWITGPATDPSLFDLVDPLSTKKLIQWCLVLVGKCQPTTMMTFFETSHSAPGGGSTVSGHLSCARELSANSKMVR